MAATPRLSGRERLMHVASTALFLFVLMVVGIAVMVWGGRGFPEQPMSFVRGPIAFSEVGVIAIVYVLIGRFLVHRLPAHVFGWCLLLIGLGVALHMPASLAIEGALRSFRPVPPMLEVAVWGLTSAFVPLAVSLIAYLLLVLPDGRLPSRRWKGGAFVTILGFHVLTLATALEPSGLVWFPTLPNPIGIPVSMARAVGVLRLVGVGLLVLGFCGAAAAMMARYRRGDAALRRQIAWVAGGGVLWAGALAPFLIVRYVVPVSDEIGTVFTTVAAAGTMLFPISIFIATTRYHLFGVEALLTRTLVYVPLMGICGGLYAAGLALAQRVFIAATGNTSDVAIVVATLLMAAAITPARRALEIGVEHLLATKRGPTGPVPNESTAAVADAGADFARLTEQASHFSARLAEIEHELAELEKIRSRDATRDAGEPGVGRILGERGAQVAGR
jgi:two-component system NarL family sensor kinase